MEDEKHAPDSGGDRLAMVMTEQASMEQVVLHDFGCFVVRDG